MSGAGDRCSDLVTIRDLNLDGIASQFLDGYPH